MRQIISTLLLASLSLGAALSTSHAMDVSGFASIGAGRVEGNNNIIGQYGNSWSMRSDTMLGLQMIAPISERASITAQAVVEGYSYDDKNDYEPAIDWLFVSYQVAPSLRVRVGRLRTPLYLHSENLLVGYSYDWVRPPIEVYNAVFAPLSSSDAIDMTFLEGWRDRDLELGFIAGRTRGRYGSTYLSSDVMFGANIALRNLSTTFRYGVVIQKASLVSSSFDPLIMGYKSLSNALGGVPVFSDLSNSFGYEGEWISYHSFGAQWQKGLWSWSSEINVSSSANIDVGFTPQVSGIYFSGSRQLGLFQPYASIGHLDLKLNDSLENLLSQSNQVILPGASIEVDGLRNATQRLVNFFNSVGGYSFTVGCRWDVGSKAALKAEMQYFDYDLEFIIQNGLPSDSKHTVLSTIILDIIF